MINSAIRETQKLMLAVAKGDHLNSMVESALYNKAVGYTEEEKRDVYKGGKLAETIIITREVEPDLNAIKMWLFNRCPNKWKEKVINEDDSMKKIDLILQELDAIINAE